MHAYKNPPHKIYGLYLTFIAFHKIYGIYFNLLLHLTQCLQIIYLQITLVLLYCSLTPSFP